MSDSLDVVFCQAEIGEHRYQQSWPNLFFPVLHSCEFIAIPEAAVTSFAMTGIEPHFNTTLLPETFDLFDEIRASHPASLSTLSGAKFAHLCAKSIETIRNISLD